jgi:cytosine/adenosine deaminase-related metal-dependent hydrolase
VGAWRSGASADFLTFDISRLDDEEGIVPGVDPMQKILARAVQGHIDRVVVRGREVVRGGHVVSIDEVSAKKELFQAYKSAIARDPAWPQWQAALNEYHHGIRNFYTQGQWLGCC